MEKGSASSWTKTGSYGADFREVSPLGRGGQGSVFKAVHILDKKEYAVKKVPFNKNRGEELVHIYYNMIAKYPMTVA
ncbi:hypothetical protein V1264_001212 [Littorina saxatilis]|uniref:Protein kinase domain-containing protein n=1 Tax=Littorina saxatilis TaxID=31220 RepID=A0AAN9GNK3_9CAEN